MNKKDINSWESAQAFVEGCLNDFEGGVSTKEETLAAFADYTLKIIEIAREFKITRKGLNA
jgi:hypothetical protein